MDPQHVPLRLRLGVKVPPAHRALVVVLGLGAVGAAAALAARPARPVVLILVHPRRQLRLEALAAEHADDLLGGHTHMTSIQRGGVGGQKNTILLTNSIDFKDKERGEGLKNPKIL